MHTVCAHCPSTQCSDWQTLWCQARNLQVATHSVYRTITKKLQFSRVDCPMRGCLKVVLTSEEFQIQNTFLWFKSWNSEATYCPERPKWNCKSRTESVVGLNRQHLFCSSTWRCLLHLHSNPSHPCLRLFISWSFFFYLFKAILVDPPSYFPLHPFELLVLHSLAKEEK